MKEAVDMRESHKTKYIILILLLMVGNYLSAQEEEEKAISLGASYISELVYNLSDNEENKPKWGNLLSLDAEMKTDRFWKDGMFKASFWSIQNSFDRHIVNDHLYFSNITASSHLLLCSVLGYEHTFGDFKLFGGIREVNVDYFTTPCDLFFTNSSAGITPTISLNYAAAVYPFSGVGIHAQYHANKFIVKNSFYNNLENVNEEQIFKLRFNPVKDGYVNFSEVEYQANNGIYSLGWVLDKSPDKALRYSSYLSAEKNIAEFSRSALRASTKIGLAPKHNHYCYAYFGTGLILSNLLENNDSDRLGVMFVYARMQDDRELATEFTYLIELTSNILLQPSLHYINNNEVNAFLGMMRVTIVLNN